MASPMIRSILALTVCHSFAHAEDESVQVTMRADGTASHLKSVGEHSAGLMRRDLAAQDPANATSGDGTNATAGAGGEGAGHGGSVAPADQCKELIYTDCRATGGFSLAKPSCYGTQPSSWGGPLECNCKVICSPDPNDKSKQTFLKEEKEPKCCSKVTSLRDSAGDEVSFKCTPWCRGDDKRDSKFVLADEMGHDASAHSKVIASENSTDGSEISNVTASTAANATAA